jgi:MFS transporter, DHA1 family, inner membrane transport protein
MFDREVFLASRRANLQAGWLESLMETAVMLELADTHRNHTTATLWSEAEESRAVMAGVVLSFVGIATFLLMPQLVEAVVADLHYTERNAGWMSSGVMLGSTVAAAVSGTWIRRISWRFAAAVAVTGQLLANVAALFFHDPGVFTGLQTLVGFFGGALYSLSLTILSDGRRADRNFAYSIGAQTVYQVVGLVAGPSLIRHGANATLLLFVGLCVLGLACVGWVPQRGTRVVSVARRRDVLSFPLLLTLAGCFLFYINIGAYWTYIERIGTAAGIGVDSTSTALALSVVVSIAGALLAFWLGDRRGFLQPLAASSLAIVVSVALLVGHFGLMRYATSAAIYAVAWNVSMTYQYSAVNVVDRSGRGVAIAPALHWAGGAAGPAFAALFVSDRSHDAVYWIVALAVTSSCGFFALALRARRIGE